MSEENTSSVGTLIIVAIAAGLIGYVVGKPDSTQQQVNNEPAKHEEAKGPPVPHAVKWNGHWYAVYNDKLVSASDAQAACVKSGGHLVVISSKSENEFVKGLAHSTLKDDNDYYIGLNRLSGKSWMWVNGEDYSKGFKNWGLEENSGPSIEKNVAMWIWENDKSEGRRSGQWASTIGGIKGYFICEWE